MTCRWLFCIAALIPLFVAQAQNHTQFSERPNLVEAFGALPMGFERNLGQAEDSVRFLSRGPGYSLYLSRGGMLLAFDSRDKAQLKPEFVHITLANANQVVEPQGMDLLPGISNYYIGNDPAKWHAGVQQFRKVFYRSVHPGVDLVFYGNHRQLEFDFDVAPGMDPSRIALRVDGARLRNRKGDLELVTPSGRVALLKKPELYQGEGKGRQTVSGGYILRAGNEVAFAVGRHDSRQALVIDPALIYSTGADPTGGGQAFAIAVDASGAAYITGQQSFPVANSPNVGNAFVVKLDPTGSNLVYQTMVGGTSAGTDAVGDETVAAGQAIAIDGSGNVYFVGTTSQKDFPTTSGVFSGTNFCANASGSVSCMEPFAAKLDSTGKLVYSTFLVQAATLDNAGPLPSAIAVDSTGAVYVTGTTAKQNGGANLGQLSVAGLTTTAGAFQTTRKNDSSAFVLKLHPDGSKLDYSTYLGGSTGETFGGIAVDSAGVAYVDGGTSSPDFPTTAAAFQTSNPGISAFFTKLSADGSSLVYSTLLGVTAAQSSALAIAVDGNRSAYLTGITNNSGFPTTAGAFKTTSAPPHNPNFPELSFVSKFDSSGNLVYSTYIGDSIAADAQRQLLFLGAPPPLQIAVDSSGAAYLTGLALPANYPMVTPILNPENPTQFVFPFITKLSSDGSTLVYSTFFRSAVSGMALDASQNVYLTGTTVPSTDDATGAALNPDAPITAGAAQNCANGCSFVAKIAPSLGAPVPVLSQHSETFTPILQKGVTSAPVTMQINNYGDTGLTVGAITIGGTDAADFAVVGAGNTCTSPVPVAGECNYLLTFTPSVTGGTETATATVAFGGGLSSQTISLTGQAGTAVFQAAPSSINFGNFAVGTPGRNNIVFLNISNPGTAPLNFLATPTFQGANSGDFVVCVVIVGACTTFNFQWPTSLAPGASFRAPIAFQPSALGPRSAQLVFTTDAAGSPQAVQLQGNGQNLALGPSSGSSSSATVTAGQTATYNVLVSTSSTVSGTITVSCAGAPSLSTCAPNPSSFSINASSSQVVAVTVTTTHAALGARNRGFWGWPTFASVFAVLLIRPRKRQWRRALLAVSGCLMLALLISCGGSSGHSPGPGTPGTPAGTYTLTVTASANGASSSMPLTLTVQ